MQRLCVESWTVGLLYRCWDVNVRLVGGHSRCAGRVEVLHRGQWGTVCDLGWEMADAAVVCRELDCRAPVQMLGAAAFDKGDTQMWTQEIQCRGNESQIHLCTTSPSHQNNGSDDNDAGLGCADSVNVRLVGGHSRCAGRGEVLHRGQWGTVCALGWDMADAAVVCRELDCRAPVQMLGAAAFDKGDTQMWTQEIQCRGNESQIHLCQTSSSHDNNCLHDNRVNVRLVNGSSRCAGRVEVLHRGQWGTVCDFGWDMAGAAVVCRELDCGEPVDALSAAHFGPGSGPIWMGIALCLTGSETTLKNCGSYGWGIHTCNHSKDAGVNCSDHTHSRLIIGPHLCSGRLEIYHNQTWMSVCDAAFDQQDAEVVCRELDCGAPVQVLGAAAFGKGSAQMRTQEIQCRGNESHIHLCPTSTLHENTCSHDNDVGGTVCDACWDMRAASVLCRQLNCGIAVSVVGSDWFGVGSGEIWADVFDCDGNERKLSECSISSWSRAERSHSRDVGVICSSKYSSLALHCAGRLEGFHSGSWGTVCDDSWDIKDAHVVCRQLQCGVALSNQQVPAWFGPGSGPIWLDEVECEGNETSLWSCSSPGWGKHDCQHKEDVGVLCSGVRLVGGSRCSGRLEILHNQTWMSVCAAAFDQQDAEVVCRELDCGAPVQVLGAASFDKGDTQMWTQEIQYSVNVRLVNGSSRCAGRVEVLHRGQWGTVCEDRWDLADAAVVCRELDCGEPVDALGDAHFGQGSGPIWINDVECSGSESTLKMCRSRGWGKHDCDHSKDAGVICSGSRCSGRLEILHNQTWMSVCDAVFDQQDAEVVCRELDCGAPVQVLGAAAFGKGDAQMWTQEIQCRGNESQIHLCPTSLSHENNCSHDNDVGLVSPG
uniref:SRCR domain-containing protein n=1 Tax=Cyprinus carpio TaxID=7962 RepID=A0A8C1ZJQ0_CYPCA